MAQPSNYKGWPTVCLSNGLVELQVLPEIGGRIIQFKLGRKEFLWFDPKLAGTFPGSNGLAADGSWFNVGGDKLWPAPQGWDNDQQWPGPPGAVLDGQPYTFEQLRTRSGEISIRLTSRKDPQTGIQFARIVRLFAGSTHVSFEATMKNIDTKPRRWGIWAHTQLDARKADGSGPNVLMQSWCPLNPKSKFPKGFDVIFGEKNNPSFQIDAGRGLMHVRYQYQVGKIGLDSHAGWVATVDGNTGAVFVQCFAFEPKKEYPDGSSVEFWHNGVGQIHAYNKDIVMSTNATENPCVFESEVLSPFAQLNPGQSYTWRYDWYACNVGGDFPVVGYTDTGVVTEPLVAEWTFGQVRLKGRFGVFVPGKIRAEFLDVKSRRLQTLDLPVLVSPLKAVALESTVAGPANAAAVKLLVIGLDGKDLGELAKADLVRTETGTRWAVEKAWRWYNSHPWLVGCNFLPSTAVNDVEMWQAESFDAKTIDRELGWAQELGFNTVRVFVNFAVWEADPAGLKDTFQQFLQIADKHGISTLVILFDDCFKPEPRVGKQPEPEPGVHNSQWVQSPGPRRRDDRKAWPKLEEYVKDIVGAFASDKRVLAWELYNEPTASLPLVEAAFQWARDAKPSQPVTTTIYGTPQMQKRILELSDVLCFHSYGPLPGMKAEVARLLAHGRPVLCTEWMARTAGSRFETHLPFLKEKKIACWSWGLVAGRSQTYFPWGSPKGAPEPKLWHHDILRIDGTPYRRREIEFIKVMTGRLPATALPQRKTVVPTAEKSPVPWRYTLAKPAADWFKAGFNDSDWKLGAAPFGSKEPPFVRFPNTAWSSADIWLRREFELPAGKFTDFAFLLHHDEDTEIYVNGILALKIGSFNAAYESFEMTPEGQGALKPGKNTLAVHCHQTSGGQYIDLGIEAIVEK